MCLDTQIGCQNYKNRLNFIPYPRIIYIKITQRAALMQRAARVSTVVQASFQFM